VTRTLAPLDVTVRVHAPRVLAALVRRYGSFADCEDAVQQALVAASEQWPRDGVPGDPAAWLAKVARRRFVDIVRSAHAREERERVHTEREVPVDDVAGADDTLQLLLLCADPAMPPAAQVALTLRAVAGLTTAQIASVFYVPEATMGQRISRAKATLRSTRVRFDVAWLDDPARLTAVHQVLYLIFTEGHTASAGAHLIDVSLAEEAIRLARQLVDRTGGAEAQGLLALMLLTHARRHARVDPAGDLVPLEDQDRAAWVDTETAEGIGLVEAALRSGSLGPFQLQAAIAAVHAEAATWADTDWPQILVLYRMLERIAPSRTVTLNLAVALAMASTPADGLALVDELLRDPQMQRNHRAWAVQGHLLERTGDGQRAAVAFRRAASMTRSIPEQRFLHRRADDAADSLSPGRSGRTGG
jgi:RNA polymerase sigma factor (sigma-70 family)